METATVNGMKFAYEVEGSGEPVLLISTGPISDSFVPFFSEQALFKHYRLIRYRQRGQTGSTGSAGPVSFAQHAADAADLLCHLGLRRAHVAGHSTGALIALQLAADYPNMVHTLSLLEPPLTGAQGAGAFFDKAGPALAAYESGDHDGAMATFLSVVSGLDWETCQTLIEKRVPGGVAQAMSDAGSFFGGYLPALGAWQLAPGQAAAITQPVLSVLGAETDPWFIDSHRLLHGWFPQVEDCTIDNVGHLLHLQRPEPVVRCMAAFVGRHPITDR